MNSALITGPLECGQLEKMIAHPWFTGAYFLNFNDQKTLEKIKNEKKYLADILDVLSSDKIAVLAVHRIDLALQALEQIQTSNITLISTSIHRKSDLTRFFSEIIYCSTELYIDLNPRIPILEVLQNGFLSEPLEKYIESVIDDNILQASLIKYLVPFQIYLSIVSESVGVKLNYTSMALKLNVDYKTIQSYYNHLIDFNLAFYLPATNLKIRAVQTQSPRFYFFDPGFERALAKKSQLKISDYSVEFDFNFKNWCISEVYKMNQVLNLRLKLSYLETKDGFEIPLIVENLNNQTYFVIFTARKNITTQKMKKYLLLNNSQTQFICVSYENNFSENFVLHFEEFFLFIKSKGPLVPI
jgi:hypothetical protein